LALVCGISVAVNRSMVMNRKLLWLLTVLFLAFIQVAEAQQLAKVPRIGFLAASTPATAAHLVEAFKQGLREHGYVEGQNVVLELRFGEGKLNSSRSLLPNWFV